MGLFKRESSSSARQSSVPAAPAPPPPLPPPPARQWNQRPRETGTTPRAQAPRPPPDTIAVGIETEFKLRHRNPTNEDSSLRLFARSLSRGHNQGVRSDVPQMESWVQNMMDSPPHMSWKLVHDPTCETQSSPWGIEMVSPIFQLMPGSAWRLAVDETWRYLQSKYVVMADETCSTHVHMSIAQDYSASQLKRLAQAVIYFEPAFEFILPESRRGNEYARSNWIDNSHFAYKRLSREDAMAVLERCTEVNEVIDLMNPNDSRYFGWNFQAIKKYKTVEFRRGAASTSVDDVFQWIELATSFLRASLRVTSVNELKRMPPTIGGLMNFLSQGTHDTPGVGDSRLLRRIFAGMRHDDRREPKPVGNLSPQKLEKLNKKIKLDLEFNPMLDSITAAQSSGLI